MLSIHWNCKEDWAYDEEEDELIVVENWEAEAVIETEEIKPLVRLVALLNKANELHYWKEEFLHGAGWFHWDRFCGFVTHEEMVSANM